MKCRYCDSFVPDYYNNCPHCGAQLIKDGFSEQHSKPAVNKTPLSVDCIHRQGQFLYNTALLLFYHYLISSCRLSLIKSLVGSCEYLGYHIPHSCLSIFSRTDSENLRLTGIITPLSSSICFVVYETI